MKYLLDTHTFLWYIQNNSALSAAALQHINDGDNELYFSVVSVWEIAIKFNLGKLNLEIQDFSFRKFIELHLSENRIELLPIQISHISLIASLPQHHRDPFDRLLIAQAQTEELSFISADAALDAYGVNRLW